METSELSETSDLSTYIPDKKHKYCDYQNMVDEAVNLLRNKLKEDEIVELSAKEIADALYFKHKSETCHSGGRKSRIQKIQHWISEYMLDIPDISEKELREFALNCLYPKYAKSTIYQAIREYFQKYPRKNDFENTVK